MDSRYRNPSAPALAALLDDYIGRYARETLARWRELFLPEFVASSTNRDGSVTLRCPQSVYVHHDAYPRFMARLLDCAMAITVGPGLDPDTKMDRSRTSAGCR